MTEKIEENKVELECTCGHKWTAAALPFLWRMKRGRLPACPDCGKVAK